MNGAYDFSMVLDLYEITLLSNEEDDTYTAVVVLDLYEITLLSNYNGSW